MATNAYGLKPVDVVHLILDKVENYLAFLPVEDRDTPATQLLTSVWEDAMANLTPADVEGHWQGMWEECDGFAEKADQT